MKVVLKTQKKASKEQANAVDFICKPFRWAAVQNLK